MPIIALAAPPRQAVADCLPHREIHLIGGASGVGKTSLVFHLLHNATHGGDFLGYKINPVPWWFIGADRPLKTALDTANRLD